MAPELLSFFTVLRSFLAMYSQSPNTSKQQFIIFYKTEPHTKTPDKIHTNKTGPGQCTQNKSFPFMLFCYKNTLF